MLLDDDTTQHPILLGFFFFFFKHSSRNYSFFNKRARNECIQVFLFVCLFVLIFFFFFPHVLLLLLCTNMLVLHVFLFYTLHGIIIPIPTYPPVYFNAHCYNIFHFFRQIKKERFFLFLLTINACFELFSFFLSYFLLLSFFFCRSFLPSFNFFPLIILIYFQSFCLNYSSKSMCLSCVVRVLSYYQLN